MPHLPPQRYHLLRFGGETERTAFQIRTAGRLVLCCGDKHGSLAGSGWGHDPYGSGSAPDDVIDMPVTLNLTAESWKRWPKLVDDVMSMKAMGKRPLWMQPLDLRMLRRWCSARVSNIRILENARNSTESLQPVRTNFQITYPAGTTARIRFI